MLLTHSAIASTDSGYSVCHVSPDFGTSVIDVRTPTAALTRYPSLNPETLFSLDKAYNTHLIVENQRAMLFIGQADKLTVGLRLSKSGVDLSTLASLVVNPDVLVRDFDHKNRPSWGVIRAEFQPVLDALGYSDFFDKEAAFSSAACDNLYSAHFHVSY